MPTDDQIRAAAYELCRLRGLDPEEQVQAASPMSEPGVMLAVYRTEPLWEQAAREIVAFLQVQQALAAVIG